MNKVKRDNNSVIANLDANLFQEKRRRTMKKRLVKLVVMALIFSLAMPMAAFASVEELNLDTTTPGIS